MHDLLARGLLHHDHKTNRFNLHPIVRRYAYDRLEGGDRAAAHHRLRDYFAAMPPPEQVRTLDDLAPVIELYYHTVAAGQYDEARTLFRDRLAEPLYFQLGSSQLIIELLRSLFPDGEDRLPRLKEERAQAWTLNELANSYGFSGQPARAVSVFQADTDLTEKLGEKTNTAIGLGNLAIQQIAIGALAAAEANLRRRIALCRELGDEYREAIGHQELGRLLAYRGAWVESEEHLASAWGRWKQDNDYVGMGQIQACRCISSLLRHRFKDAREAAIEASNLARQWRYGTQVVERDVIITEWLLGAALRAAGPSTVSGRGGLDEADRHLTEALTRCRAINLVEFEADILLDLARVRWGQALTPGPSPDSGRGERLREEAERLAEEALVITERSGYVLQGADVHLFLAEMALAQGDRAKALEHAREARRLATCDGPPDYTYEVAYDEAGALLAQLGEGRREI